MDPLQLLVDHLPQLLLLYWGLATAASTIALIPLPFAQGFRSAVLLSACRGKLMDFKPERALGLLSDWTVPQGWFAHFYAIGAVWNLLVAALFLASYYPQLDPWGQATFLVAQLLLEGHLVRRYLETTRLMRYPPGARMHGIAYLFGLSYYLIVPVTILPVEAYPAMYATLRQPSTLLAALYTPLVPALLRQLPMLRQLAGSLSLVQWTGIAVFVGSNLLQWHSHKLLARLGAKAASAKGGAPAYKVPQGGAFNLVSSPHYLAEILIYLGLLLAEGGGRLLMWLMLAWVTSNLLLAGGLTHRWYKKHFKHYPKDRFAIVPFIY